MYYSRKRFNNSFDHQNSRRPSSCGILRPSSCLFLPNSQSRLIENNNSVFNTRNKNSLSSSSLWRSVCAARCEKHLSKEPIEPIRKNLSQKMVRLKAKRQQQQQKYQNMISIIRKKCGNTTDIKKQHFKQAHQLIIQWLSEQKLEKCRYQKRLLRLKS